VRPAEIRKALQDNGVAMAFTSIRHALGQLEQRNAAEQSATAKPGVTAAVDPERAGSSGDRAARQRVGAFVFRMAGMAPHQCHSISCGAAAAPAAAIDPRS